MAAFTVYWQPGCSSCLRAKEFLTAHCIDFVSVNVREDHAGRDALAAHGIRTVPIVMRGDAYVHGQNLDELARFVGVDPAREKLPLAVLTQRIDVILAAAARYVRQIPGDVLGKPMPGRDRTALDLAYHVGVVPTAFLDAVNGGSVTFAHFEHRAPAGANADTVARFLRGVATDIAAWWSSGLRPETVATYYGAQSLHAMLERTCWHAAQHTRQLMALVAVSGRTPDGALTDADLAGLPLPQEVYDDQVKLAG